MNKIRNSILGKLIQLYQNQYQQKGEKDIKAELKHINKPQRQNLGVIVYAQNKILDNAAILHDKTK